MGILCLTVCFMCITRTAWSILYFILSGSGVLTGLTSGTHRLRVVPFGCEENKGVTERFEVL